MIKGIDTIDEPIAKNNIIIKEEVKDKEKMGEKMEEKMGEKMEKIELIQGTNEEKNNKKNIIMTKEKKYSQDINVDTDKHGVDEFKEDLDSLLLESAKAKSRPKWIQMLTTI